MMITAKRQLPRLFILCCMLLFLYCIGATVAPLQRSVGTPLLSWLPTNGFLEAWGIWLPVDLHLVSNIQTSQTATTHLEFFLLITVAFVVYGIAALVIRYRLKDTKHTSIFVLLWVGAILAGLIFVLTPAMLSHDVFVYADYGHTIVAHSVNPYFVPPGLDRFSRDTFTQFDDWRMYIAAYGPLWLDICAFLARLLGNIPWHYILAFRLLGLAAHLLNIALVTLILGKAGCTKRTILFGTWLYAMNPLVLLESSLGAHNDIFIATLLLSGVLLCFRAEEKGFSQPANYIPPVVVFTLSALIKVTTLPLILLFLALLAGKASCLSKEEVDKNQYTALHCWYCAGSHVFFAIAICILTILAFYMPFWMGHTVKEVSQSFSLPPSSVHSENSLSRVFYGWVKLHGLPPRNSWVYLPVHLLSKHNTWTMLTVVVVGCIVAAGLFFLWRRPATETLILAALCSLGGLLIVTPWFYPWYSIWLIALAGASFAVANNRMRWALVGFALMFSFTALLTYMTDSFALLGDWTAFVQYTLIPGLPLLVFVVLVRNDATLLRSSRGVR